MRGRVLLFSPEQMQANRRLKPLGRFDPCTEFFHSGSRQACEWRMLGSSGFPIDHPPSAVALREMRKLGIRIQHLKGVLSIVARLCSPPFSNPPRPLPRLTRFNKTFHLGSPNRPTSQVPGKLIATTACFSSVKARCIAKNNPGSIRSRVALEIYLTDVVS